nr:hypothetical protein [Cylindrospermopsis raciborskii]
MPKLPIKSFHMQEFQLRIVPTDNNNFAVELYQCAYKKQEKRNVLLLNELAG